MLVFVRVNECAAVVESGCVFLRIFFVIDIGRNGIWVFLINLWSCLLVCEYVVFLLRIINGCLVFVKSEIVLVIDFGYGNNVGDGFLILIIVVNVLFFFIVAVRIFVGKLR